MSPDEHAPAAAGQGTAAGLAQGDGEHTSPHQTLHPMMLAAGIALLAFGLLTSLTFTALGVALIGWGLGGWIAELRRA